MQDLGEQIVGDWLKLCRGCEFVEYNLPTTDKQGEIDVVGINIQTKKVYVCEVATHLETGMRYTKDGRSDNIERFCKKFKKDILYAKIHFECCGFGPVYMLWSPIVKGSDQQKNIEVIREKIKNDEGVDLELVINEEYKKRFDDLRAQADGETKALKSPVLRLMQIEGKLSSVSTTAA